jgi:23S rRNA (cytosine1962-C5)-methyltransferase
VVKLYTPALFPHLDAVVAALVELLAPERVVLRLARSVAKGDTGGLADGDTIVGPAPDGPVLFREGGLVMEADVVRGQKTGHFLDQRDNRALVRSLAAGADVLDVFASTGGFSVNAAAGGARSVHLVDQSAPALATAERNLAHNHDLPEVRACRVRTTVGDAFEVLEALARQSLRYDIVIVDPPSFAANQASVPRALAAYARLTDLAVRLVRPGGTLVQSSCSSRIGDDDFVDAVVGAASRAGVHLRIEHHTGHAVDHPIGFEFGRYLKTVFATCTPGRSVGHTRGRA